MMMASRDSAKIASCVVGCPSSAEAGGLAVAASRGATGELAASLVRGADRRIAVLSQRWNIPYLQASALADVADAFSELGDMEIAAERRHQARDLASRHGFHEILFRLESAASRDDRRRREAESSAPWEIVQAIESITSPDRLTETALELCVA